jgi:hypothetical protein
MFDWLMIVWWEKKKCKEHTQIAGEKTQNR